MIELNESYASILRQLGSNTTGGSYRYHNGLDLSNNMLFNRFLSVDTSGPTIEVPAIVKDAIVSTIVDTRDTNKIVVPLYAAYGSYACSIKTATTIIKRSIGIPYSERLKKIKDGKDRIYYIGNGLILDEKLNPLFMVSFMYHKSENSLNGYKILFRMSPEFYLDTTNIINKELLRKVIPWYMENCAGFDTFMRRINTMRPYNVNLLIEDFNYMFSSPGSPNADVTNEYLNTLLLNNSNTIITQLMESI